jgi:hypothetical protein
VPRSANDTRRVNHPNHKTTELIVILQMPLQQTDPMNQPMEKKAKKQKIVDEPWYRRHETEENGLLKLRQEYTEGTTNPRSPVLLNDDDKFPDIQLIGDKKLSCSIRDVGYSLIRATHCVHDGSFYFEVKIENPIQDGGHTRIGWARRPAKTSFPCGNDQFSYSYRDIGGDVFHDGFSKSYGGSYKAGDVIGCYIHLPRYDFTQTESEIERFVEHGVECEWTQEKIPLVPLKGSFMKFYLNGKDQGIAFADLIVGKYYPAISVYRGGYVTCEFVDFKYPPKNIPFSAIKTFI